MRRSVKLGQATVDQAELMLTDEAADAGSGTEMLDPISWIRRELGPPS